MHQPGCSVCHKPELYMAGLCRDCYADHHGEEKDPRQVRTTVLPAVLIQRTFYGETISPNARRQFFGGPLIL